MPSATHRLLHLGEGVRRPVHADDVFHLEADGSDTIVRMRGTKPIMDVRPLGEVLAMFAPHGFVQIHRSHAINIRRVFEIRRRDDGRDWELRLEPPVGTILPVSRSHLQDLWSAYEG